MRPNDTGVCRSPCDIKSIDVPIAGRVRGSSSATWSYRSVESAFAPTRRRAITTTRTDGKDRIIAGRVDTRRVDEVFVICASLDAVWLVMSCADPVCGARGRSSKPAPACAACQHRTSHAPLRSSHSQTRRAHRQAKARATDLGRLRRAMRPGRGGEVRILRQRASSVSIEPVTRSHTRITHKHDARVAGRKRARLTSAAEVDDGGGAMQPARGGEVEAVPARTRRQHRTSHAQPHSGHSQTRSACGRAKARATDLGRIRRRRWFGPKGDK